MPSRFRFSMNTTSCSLTFAVPESGRETDKAGECGFTIREAENGAVFFDEARLVLECRKIYLQDLDPSHFLDDSIMRHYPQKDFHRMYIGEITRVLVAD